MIQHSPSIVLAAWVGLLALGCTWILPMLVLFVVTAAVAGAMAIREYPR